MFDHSATKLLASALFTKAATCLIGEFIHFALSKDFINEVDRGVDAYHSKKYRNVRHLTRFLSDRALGIETPLATPRRVY
jgi:hypothetical protein